MYTPFFKLETTMGKNNQVLCKVCYRTIRGNNLKRHLQVHIRFKKTLDQNTKGVHMKYRGNTREEDNEKDSCHNED